MGEYFIAVNTDRQQMVHPHRLGLGMKFDEILHSAFGRALTWLLRAVNEEDDDKTSLRGTWAGNAITVVGDYHESGLYDTASLDYLDVTDQLRKELNRHGVAFCQQVYGDTRDELAACIERECFTPSLEAMFRFRNEQRIDVYADQHLYNLAATCLVYRDIGHERADQFCNALVYRNRI